MVLLAFFVKMLYLLEKIVCYIKPKIIAFFYIPYRGYFSGGGRGVKISWFSWLSSEPRNIYP